MKKIKNLSKSFPEGQEPLFPALRSLKCPEKRLKCPSPPSSATLSFSLFLRLPPSLPLYLYPSSLPLILLLPHSPSLPPSLLLRMKKQTVGEMGGRGERSERRKGSKGERGMREERKERGASEKSGGGAIKGEGGERRVEGHKRKGTEGWVKGEQPGIVGPTAVSATCLALPSFSVHRTGDVAPGFS